MRRVLVLLMLCGCATASSSTESDQGAARPVIFTGDRILEGERPRAAIAIIPALPSAVWPATKRVYQSLGVDVTVDNPAAHQLGNQSFFKSRTLGSHRMSEFVDCGQSMTGPKADSYRIYMTLLTTIDSDGSGGTKMETTFFPLGQDIAGGSTDRMPCGSTGHLEALIGELVKQAVEKR